MWLFRPTFVSFLIVAFLSQGLHSKSLVDKPFRKSFTDLILIHCSDPEHRHPPMNLPESGEDIQLFVLVLKESVPRRVTQYSSNSSRSSLLKVLHTPEIDSCSCSSGTPFTLCIHHMNAPTPALNDDSKDDCCISCCKLSTSVAACSASGRGPRPVH